MEQNIQSKINTQFAFSDNLRKIFYPQGLKNVFYHMEELGNPNAQPWIFKSKYELNRFAQYVISLNIFKKEKPDYHTCQAIHETLNSCSVSIVFSLFNLFAIQTKTKACFFDTSMRDYFIERAKLSNDELYLLSFIWHEPLLLMNSLGYSADQNLKIYFSENDIGFKVLKVCDEIRSSEMDQIENQETINSEHFYTYHLFQLLSTIDLVANLLNPGITSPSHSSSFLQIENYQDLYNLYEEIL